MIKHKWLAVLMTIRYVSLCLYDHFWKVGWGRKKEMNIKSPFDFPAI